MGFPVPPINALHRRQQTIFLPKPLNGGPVTRFLSLRDYRYGFKSANLTPSLEYDHNIIRTLLIQDLERTMGEVIRFIPKSERERIRLIREARAIYESIFPSTNAVGGQRHKTSTSRAAGDSNALRRGDVKPS